jgi:BASS family bile acid:Na+ symporter
MSAFLTLFVLLPSGLGVLARQLVGARLAGHARPTLKLMNSLILLVLNYTNASASLAGIVDRPDWGFVGVASGAALGMCVVAFAAGWLLAKLVRAEEGQRTALMFGLGLNNNSTGLVLASVVLANLPGVMLPAILYTLIQHVAAGVISTLYRRQAAIRDAASVPAPEPPPGRIA